MATPMAATGPTATKIHKMIAIPWEAVDSDGQEATEDFKTASHQNQSPNHPDLLFVGKAPIVQMESQGYPCRERGIRTAMIHTEVMAEPRVVRTVQGSMAVDLEAGRSKVSRLLVEHQPKGQQQFRVLFSCLFGAGFRVDWACWAMLYI